MTGSLSLTHLGAQPSQSRVHFPGRKGRGMVAQDFDLQVPAGRLHARRFGAESGRLVLGIPGLSLEFLTESARGHIGGGKHQFDGSKTPRIEKLSHPCEQLSAWRVRPESTIGPAGHHNKTDRAGVSLPALRIGRQPRLIGLLPICR